MIFLLTSCLLLALGLGLAFYLWRREKRFLKNKTSKNMSRAVWDEIVREREEALRKRRLFHEALTKAKRK